jgi:Transposase, Mutator family
MSIPITRRIGCSSPLLCCDGSSGQHDNYGSALSAQPGRSRGRPATNTSSRLIEYIGLPTLRAPGAPRPGWSHHTPEPPIPAERAGTAIFIPVTNAIEALNSKLRRAVRARGHFPSDEAATKLLFLVLNRSEKQWIMPPREWAMAKSQFAVLFGERFTTAMA